jgi:hypothetical protein
MYDGNSDPKQFLMRYDATISSYGGNTVVMAKSFVMAVRSVAQTWLFFPSTGNNHVMAEAKGHAGNQLLGFPDKANDCSSSIPMHTGPRGIPAGICPKVSAS